MPLPAIPLIFSGLAWIGQAIYTFFAGFASEIRRYAFRALAVAAAAGSFWLAFQIIYDSVKSSMDAIVSQIQGAQGSLGFTMELGLCLLPATFPDAISAFFGIVLAAVTTKWVRQMIFIKLA